jgi:hypothetical protein
MSKHAAELTRKDMKAPDAFQTAAVKAATWVSGKQKFLVGGVVAVLVGVAVVIGGMSWSESRKVAAGGLLFRTLDDADGQISSVPLPGVTVPIFPNTEAQQRAVLARADELRKTFPSTEAARTVALASAPPRDSLVFVAIEGVARAKEAKGDPAGALVAFERLQTQVPARADRAALERTRLLARAGKVDEARKMLQAFPQDFKESQLRPEADKQLAALGGAR